MSTFHWAIIDDGPTTRRLTRYSDYWLDADDTDRLIVLCYLLSPDELIDKCIFHRCEGGVSCGGTGAGSVSLGWGWGGAMQWCWDMGNAGWVAVGCGRVWQGGGGRARVVQGGVGLDRVRQGGDVGWGWWGWVVVGWARMKMCRGESQWRDRMELWYEDRRIVDKQQQGRDGNRGHQYEYASRMAVVIASQMPFAFDRFDSGAVDIRTNVHDHVSLSDNQ